VDLEIEMHCQVKKPSSGSLPMIASTRRIYCKGKFSEIITTGPAVFMKMKMIASKPVEFSFLKALLAFEQC
jgi:hypothetical protein